MTPTKSFETKLNSSLFYNPKELINLSYKQVSIIKSLSLYLYINWILRKYVRYVLLT